MATGIITDGKVKESAVICMSNIHVHHALSYQNMSLYTPLISFRSGNVYEGGWINNKRHGHGTMWWHDRAERYVGEWIQGVQVFQFA